MTTPQAPQVKPHISLGRYYRLVRNNPNFRRLWIAQIVSELGDWFYAVAIYDLVLRLTGSAQAVGLVVLLHILPQFFMGTTAGAVNDRVSRKAIMIVADVARAVIVMGMMLVRTSDWLWLLYVLLATEVISASFFEPGRTAVIPNIVGEEEALAANALSSATWSFNLAVGTGLGGLAIHFLGRESAFLINSLSFVISAVLIGGMRFEEPHVSGRRHLKWIDVLGLGPVVEGIRYVQRDPRLRSTLFLKFGLGWLGANLVLLPVMAAREFHVPGALGMSTLFMFRGIGAIIGPFLGGWLAGSSQRRMRIGILLGFLTVSAFYVLFSRAPSLALASAGVRCRPVSEIAAWFSVVDLSSGVETVAVSATPSTVMVAVWVTGALVLPPTAASSVVEEVKLSVSWPSNSLVGV